MKKAPLNNHLRKNSELFIELYVVRLPTRFVLFKREKQLHFVFYKKGNIVWFRENVANTMHLIMNKGIICVVFTTQENHNVFTIMHLTMTHLSPHITGYLEC